MKNSSNNPTKYLSVMLPLLYFASYLTRKSYSTVIADIIVSENLSNESAALASTLSVISYGAGQILSGFLGDRFSPRKIIFYSLSFSALINILVPFVPNSSVRAVLWFLNGLAQAFIWPPIVKILSTYSDPDTYYRICSNVSIAASVGTVSLYLTSGLLWVKYFSWHATFFYAAASAGIIVLIWGMTSAKQLRITPPPDNNISTTEKTKFHLPSGKVLAASGFFFLILAIVCQGAIRDGLTDWMPTLIVDNFNSNSDMAILEAVLLPLFAAFAIKVGGCLFGKIIHYEPIGAAVFFSIGLGSAFLLRFYGSKSQFVAIATASLLIGCVHIINHYLVNLVPLRFKRYHCESTMSGIINAFTYVGSALATYGFGWLSDTFNWNICLSVLIAVCGIGLLCCLVIRKKWMIFVSSDKSQDNPV